MTVAAAVWQLATRGTVTRTLDADTAAVLARSWRWLPDALRDIVPERAALYGGDVAMAAADALESWWRADGVAWTVEEYARTMREVATCDGRKLAYEDM
jgi:hypothetical protein